MRLSLPLTLSLSHEGRGDGVYQTALADSPIVPLPLTLSPSHEGRGDGVYQTALADSPIGSPPLDGGGQG